MAQGRRHRVVAALAAAALAGACGVAPPAMRLAWQVSGAKAGRPNIEATLHVTDPKSGTPLSGARLRLEGHMSHPGMAPAVAEMKETGEGRYEASLPLSMPGAWTLVVSGTLADGRRVTWDEADPINIADPAS